MRLVCKRINQWKPCSGNTADLWLLLTASELLRIASYVAEFGALSHQERVAVAQAACSSFLSCGCKLAALVAAEALHGCTPAALDDLAALHGSLMALAQSGILDVQQLGLNAAELAPPEELVKCLAAAVEMAKVLGSSPATGGCGFCAAGVAGGALCCSHVAQCCAAKQHEL